MHSKNKFKYTISETVAIVKVVLILISEYWLFFNLQSKINEHHNAASQDSHGATSVTQDGVSKLFGQEHGGRVRGLGFGVVPSQLRIRGSSSGEVHALRNQVSGLETKVQELTTMLMVSVNQKFILTAIFPVFLLIRNQVIVGFRFRSGYFGISGKFPV